MLIATFQLVPFVYKGDNQPSKILSHCQKNKEGFFALQMLVCGNVFMAGEHGFLKSDAIDCALAFKLVANGIPKAQKLLSDKTKKKISVQLFKEFTPETLSPSEYLKAKGYQDFEIDMYMVLPIAPNWDSMDAYFQSYRAKFRTKANNVYARASSLSLKSFSAAEILNLQTMIDKLFKNVLRKSEYEFGVMNAHAFSAIKEQLQERFIFRGVLLDNTLVGFSTSFVNGSVLEANYVGIDYDKNIDHAIYQRILYDYVSIAIELELEMLYLGRTSELLKSSLGAQPMPMRLYAKHTSKITHLLMASILKKVSPSSFELRKPFKAAYYLD